MAKIISPVRLDKKKGLRKYFKGDQVQLMILMIPVVIWLLVFCYTPMAGAVVAFKNYKITILIFKILEAYGCDKLKFSWFINHSIGYWLHFCSYLC